MLNEDTHDRILGLMADVVRRYMPNEIAVFELKRGKHRLDSTTTATSSDADRARDLTSDFGPSEKIALECVPLVLGSIKAAAELLKTLRDGRRSSPTLEIEEVKKKWNDELITEGLSADRAAEVTSTFAADLTRLLT